MASGQIEPRFPGDLIPLSPGNFPSRSAPRPFYNRCAMTRNLRPVLLAVLLFALTAMAAKKDTGSTTLKNLETVATTSKQNKNQQYDFSFETSAKRYVCRTSPKTSVKATDFVVGAELKYEINGNKGELKSSSGKQVKCTVVRVEEVSAPSAPQK